ncbi:hypothetical protein N7486_009138 [Penicillium sp. IBT 16267x]|nr:hypothetical protein N7486_009138 [Penicillium sp. IBT 16267x]
MSRFSAGPTFLQSEVGYREYLRLGELDRLHLPAYEKDDEGRIIINPGEAFCRIRNCPSRMKPRMTRNLRLHMQLHELEVAPGLSGRQPIEVQCQAVDWYTGILKNERNAPMQGLSTLRNGGIEKPSTISPSPEPLPKVPVPLKGKSGKISQTGVRRAVKDNDSDVTFPCIRCDTAGKSSTCGKNYGICDFLDLFDLSACKEHNEALEKLAEQQVQLGR